MESVLWIIGALLVLGWAVWQRIKGKRGATGAPDVTGSGTPPSDAGGGSDPGGGSL